MRVLYRRAAVRVAAAAGAGMLAAGLTAAAGPARAEAAAARVLAAGRGGATVSGTWGTAQEIPGTAGLNAGGFAAVTSVSCATAGNCSAAGYYVDSAGDQQVFVVTQANGAWGTAVKVPGLTSLDNSGIPVVTSVSCGSAGNCSAGGSYQDGHGHRQVFVVAQANGIWGTAKEVPGTARLNAGGYATVNSVSCATAGNCSAAGYYADGAGHRQAFVVTQANGIWGTAKEVPGTARLNTVGAQVNSVSCGAAGDCSAGGTYSDSGSTSQAFVVTQANGNWGTAKEVPGTAALNVGGYATVNSVSCATAGNCSAGGNYQGGTTGEQAFVVTQTNGTWGKAEEVPGTATLNTGGNAAVNSVSCPSAGNCTAAGYYFGSGGGAFVVTQANGTWGTAQEIPGMASLAPNGGKITSVSCAAANRCSAGGQYGDSADNLQAFVVTES